MNWRKVYSRPSDLQSDYLGRCIYFVINSYKRLQHLEVLPDGRGQADHFVVEAEWDVFMRRLASRILSGRTSAADHPKIFQRLSRRFLRASKHIRDFRRLTNDQLLAYYRGVKAAYLDYTYFFWLPWAINEVVEPRFREGLQRRFPTDWQRLYEATSLRCRPNRMEIQQEQLVKLRPRTSSFEQHAAAWGYLSVYTYNEKPWNAAHFRRLRNELVTNRTFVKNRLAIAENRRRFNAARRRLHRFPNLLGFADTISYFNYLRTERIDVWREALAYGQRFFRELERRFALSPRTAPFLTEVEIVSLLRTGRAVPHAKLRARLRGRCALRIVNSRIVVEERSSVITRLRSNLLHAVESTEIRGASAYPGRVVGRVKIVKVTADIGSFPRGAILVSPMTHPDYLFAIERAAAIVTDEGGITSHAAVIARELKKPTVISTKHATQALKDGDRVEVDATEGVIRKLHE